MINRPNIVTFFFIPLTPISLDLTLNLWTFDHFKDPSCLNEVHASSRSLSNVRLNQQTPTPLKATVYRSAPAPTNRRGPGSRKRRPSLSLEHRIRSRVIRRPYHRKANSLRWDGAAAPTASKDFL